MTNFKTTIILFNKYKGRKKHKIKSVYSYASYVSYIDLTYEIMGESVDMTGFPPLSYVSYMLGKS